MTDKSESKKFSRKQLDAAMRKVYASFRHRSNFTGVDVGYRWDGDKKTDQQVVRVHVDAKLPMAELCDGVAFPEEIDRIPLDVIEEPYKARKGSGGPKRRAPVLMAEAAARGQGGVHTAPASGMRRELTPAPDWPWPVDPLPPYGGSCPRPPCPGPPFPAPWWPRGGAPMPRRGGGARGCPRPLGPDAAAPSTAARPPAGRDALRPEKFSPALFQDTWERLQGMMICWGGSEFDDLRLGDGGADRIPSPCWHNELAYAVRGRGYFDGVLWED